MTTRYTPLAVRAAVCGLFLGLGAAPLVAQQTASRAPAPTRLSPADRASALREIAKVLAEEYVVPDMRTKLVERLTESERKGRYDVAQPYLFAERVTEDMRDVARDGHLALRHAPAQYAAAIAPPTSRRGSEAFAAERAVRSHHGLEELRVLPGNIRYLKLTGFEWVPDQTGLAYDGAMQFLRDGDAVIIDLRGNGGGHAAAVQYLVSHFLPADTLLLTFVQGSETPFQSRTLNHLPSGRLLGKPLYVLIDGNVASAAEEFAYHVQQFGLGELVGARTAGGANNNRLVPVAPEFILSVSIGRPVHAVSGTNWEGTGIAPSVEAEPSRALEVAQSLALSRLSGGSGVEQRRLAEYEWAKTAVEARLEPVTLSPKQLRALAGRYGEVKVELRDGALWMARPERPTRRLVPLNAEGLFAVDGLAELRVRFTTRTLEILGMGDSEPRMFERS